MSLSSINILLRPNIPNLHLRTRTRQDSISSRMPNDMTCFTSMSCKFRDGFKISNFGCLVVEGLGEDGFVNVGDRDTTIFSSGGDEGVVER